MQMCIHARGVVLTESVKGFAYDKIVAALKRLGTEVSKISLYLVDVNGPERGGQDKLCRVVVRIHNQDMLVLEDRDSSVGAAIDRLGDRLCIAANRRVDRARRRPTSSRGWQLEA